MFMEAPDFDDIERFLAKAHKLRALTYYHLLRRLAITLRHGVTVVSDAARRAIQAFVRNRRRHAYLETLQSLDNRTLKDIGVHRSELHSVVQELVDDAPASRLRTPAWSARVGTIANRASTAANDFADEVA